VTTLTLGRMVGLFADVHGSQGTLVRALEECREAGVDQIALLGDLFDRVEQADGCARALVGWPVVGVWGNHEREIVLDAAEHGTLETDTVQLLTGLGEVVLVEDVCLMHEAAHWGRTDALARVLGRADHNGHLSHHARARITFAGHTHYRSARDERGPLDVARGSLTLDPARRYLINPGALAAGQYAVWDREAGVVRFREV
jgi:predicted phosphodiesterase